MDFENLKQFALSQDSELTGQDLSDETSEEAMAFLDQQRDADLDSRMSSVVVNTNPDERGESSLQDTADSTAQVPVITDGPDSSPEQAFQQEGEAPTPAEAFSDVALGDTLQESSLQADSPSEAPPAEFTEPTAESHSAAEPQQFFQEQVPPESFATNAELRDEGVQVDNILNERNETTWMVPESLDYFPDMLREADQYSPPVPAGDDIEIPEMQDRHAEDLLENTSELAERMVSDLSDNILTQERNRP